MPTTSRDVAVDDASGTREVHHRERWDDSLVLFIRLRQFDAVFAGGVRFGLIKYADGQQYGTR